MKKINLSIIAILVSFCCFFVVKPVFGAGFIHFTWESDSKAPNEYKGKNLATVESMVKVSAQPIGFSSSFGNPDSWNYRWYLDGNFIIEGKNLKNFRFLLEDYYVSKYVVKLKVNYGIGEFTQEFNLPISSPKVVLKVLEMNKEKAKLIAEPYFFRQPVVFNWKANQLSVKSESGGNIVNVKKSANYDILNVNLTASSVYDSLVRAVAEIQLNFSKI